MILKSLFLRNFRNFAQTEIISLAPHINMFCGANAQGKTSILEAIHFLSTGRSFRTAHLKDLIKNGEDFFIARAHFEKDGVEQQLEVFYNGKEKRISHNQTNYTSLSSLLGLLPSVTYTPSDQEMIDGSPSLRRRFINIHIAQYDPLYVYHLSRYYKALKYRNILLRKKDSSTLEPWEDQMARSAAYLIQKREEMINELQTIIPSFLKELTHTQETVELCYQPSIPYHNNETTLIENYKAILNTHREKDYLLKNTTLGPHRDDLQILINDNPAKGFASEGQKRTFSLALRLSAWKQLSSWMDDTVLFSVDDMGMQLDDERKTLLMEKLSKLPQVCITTPQAPQFPSSISTNTLNVSQGQVNQEMIAPV